MAMLTDEILGTVKRWNGILPSPSKEALKNPKGLKVFKNSFIETYIARAHPMVPGLWAVPVSAFLFWMGLNYQTLGSGALLFGIGFFSWTLLEYAIHLIVFHKKITPKTPEMVKFTIFMLHGYHHEYPNDPTRLVMPIILAWPLATLIGLGFWLALGTSLFFSFYSGILIGYVAYDWGHYYEHHIRPKTKAGLYMRKFHAIHHFVDENKNFGISTPIWDWVFRKAQEPGARTEAELTSTSSAS